MPIMERRERRQVKSERKIRALLPKSRGYLYKKRHVGEPLEDFKRRRKASNWRRRLAEKNPLLFKKF